MNQTELRIILTNLYENKISPADAIKQLQNMPYENIDFAKIDHHRELRSGLPEVIYGQGKSIVQLKKIIRSLKIASSDTLATKISGFYLGFYFLKISFQILQLKKCFMIKWLYY